MTDHRFTMPAHDFVYHGRIERVIDGDTVIATIDMGMHISRTERFRLAFINTPELNGPDAIAARNARGFVVAWNDKEERTNEDFPLVIRTTKTDEYGRWLATIFSAKTGDCLNKLLLDHEYATEWPIAKREKMT